MSLVIGTKARSSVPADPDGRGRLEINAKWRIAAASVTLGLLLCGAFAFTLHSRGVSVRADAQAHLARQDALAAERAVTAFWITREVMGEFLAFPSGHLAAEVRQKRLSLRQALGGMRAESPAELAAIERAKAANGKLIAVFDDLRAPSGGVRDGLHERRLHRAEQSVLGPIEQLRINNHRDDQRAETATDSAQRALFRSEIATALLGFVAVVMFSLFAVRQVRRIDDQNAELQAADLAKDEFISTISHELRTPLTSIYGYVELLLEEDADPLTEQQRDHLATVQRGSVRLDRLINDLLFTAQARAGHIDIQKTRTDIVKITRQAVESAQAHAGHKVLQLSVTAPPHAIAIDADVVRMGQSIDNLISNAIKFTPENGRVDVTLTENAGRVSLTVADTGMGMTAADIGRLFERFFRSDSAQTQHIQGSGLGLPIVKAIVEAHDGTITVTSEPNVGTSFVMSLPLARPHGYWAPAGRQNRLVAA